MDFVEWWKKTSKEASEAHYALRFDEGELNEIRRGSLSDSAEGKVRSRLASLKKRSIALWIGCGIPSVLFALTAISVLGFVFFRAFWQNARNPIVWILIIFFLFVTIAILLFAVKIFFEWQRRRSGTAVDLQSNKVGIARGKVFIKISHTENSFNISYFMNNVEYILFDDALGWEIHTHFFGGPNITGQSSRETREDYIFYFLPESKRLLHFELARN
jgi:hypothetical protein